MAPDAVRDGERLAALRDTTLLDAGPDETFSRLNRLAVELLGVSVSLVSLVGEDRQVWAGQAGLPEPWASHQETRLSHSFSQHVVASDQPLVIEDARSHPLVRGSRAIRDLGFVAYAGMPLRMPDGNVLGAFCAVDRHPRRWTDRELGILSDLAGLTSELLDLRRVRALPAMRDALTDLMSPALFGEMVAQSIMRATRTQTCTSILAIGLDGFRLINSGLGHAAGDQILLSVASRLTVAVREGDAVCRLAGDEFLVLCESAEDEADALRIAERLRQAVVEEPVIVNGHTQAVAATLGVACTRLLVDAEELIESAVGELVRAKRGVSRREENSAPAPPERAGHQRRLRVRNGIADAHERGELHVVYQPLMQLSSGRMTGVEALVRWRHPDLGLVSPDEFIPAAEASGAVVALGEWVLRQACRDLSTWTRQSPGHNLSLAVNVAPVQMHTAGFADVVASALDDCGLTPSALILEITERTLLDGRGKPSQTMARLHELGARLALDDFGTGYSSLAYLTRFPIDLLKIDRMFINTIDNDPRSAALVNGILKMTDSLQLQSVAEGIETEPQRELLSEMGSHFGQGYLFSPPVPAATIAGHLERYAGGEVDRDPNAPDASPGSPAERPEDDDEHDAIEPATPRS